ncbi:cation transporter [Thalassoglobus sp.]|uniref:cation transporter n=1 Tax=Thalassoglobus sp. TaxID=2795869 RepID=UPI003AA8B4D5
MNAHRLFFSCLLASLVASPILADEITVEGVHLCCGKCVTGAKDALTDVDGVSRVRVNKTKATVVFEATNSKSAQSGLKSLAEAGFYGKPSIEGPKFEIDKTAKKDAVSVEDMHLCCGGCFRAAEKAAKSVEGVTEAKANGDDGTLQLTGSKISHAAVLKALHEAGFHGTVK